VELIAQSFLEQLNTEHKTNKVLTPEVLAELNAHSWPGNVRELKNYMQRAFIMADDSVLRPLAVPLQVSPARPTANTAISIAVGTSLADADRQLIMATLEQCGGVKKRAAEVLGISLKTLYNRLEEYGASNKSGTDDIIDNEQEETSAARA